MSDQFSIGESAGATGTVWLTGGQLTVRTNSYIGNAPNFMVKAIAEDRGIRMPSFFGYMAWSCSILLPLFALITWIYFV